MRAVIVAAAFLPVALFAAEPKVFAQISDDDVHQICKTVASVTADPVTMIAGVLSSEPISGAAARKGFHFAADGSKVWSKFYERADLVWAVTPRKTGLPVEYQLEKSEHGWKIVKNQQMVDWVD